jgi:hypothetical protein
MLDARVRYLFGTEAAFVRRGDVRELADGTLVVQPRRTRTNMLLPQLGISVRF